MRKVMLFLGLALVVLLALAPDGEAGLFRRGGRLFGRIRNGGGGCASVSAAQGCAACYAR